MGAPPTKPDDDRSLSMYTLFQDPEPRASQRHPVNELIRNYVRGTSDAATLSVGTRRLERPQPVGADELWDYLGDFA
jgi:hypothetical protein